MKAVVYNLGCKVNKYECDSLLKSLKEKGYDASEELEPADFYILNTCAVTNEAERKSRQCVTRCLKLNPNAKIIVCGCASQNNAEQFANKKGVVFVKGVADKQAIIDELDKTGVEVRELPKAYEDDFSPEVVRTRAYVKIQDGCNNFCSYCLIPYLRGRSRSREVASIVRECEELAKKCKEITLTGIDISSYGKDTGTNLAALVKKLGHIDCRIRLGSLEVNVIDRELLSALKGLKKFCPQFHLSLQSGEDGVLKKMNRHYTTAQYAQKVALIREYFEDSALTTDLICGFPTESEEAFESTLEFIKETGFYQVHCFGYSPRKGTVAAKYKLPAPEVLKDRCSRASKVAEQCKEEYLEKYVGKTLELLTEDEENGYMCGYTRQYIKTYVKDVAGDTLCNVKIVGIKDGIAIGEVVEIL